MVPVSKIQVEKVDSKEELKHIKQHLKERTLDGSNLIASQKFSDAHNILSSEINTLNSEVKFKIINQNKILKAGLNSIKIELNLNNDKETVEVSVKNVKENQTNDADLIQKIKNKMNNYLKNKKFTENDSTSSIIDKLLYEGNSVIKDANKHVKVKSSTLPKHLDANTSPTIHFYLQTSNKKYDLNIILPKIKADPVKKMNKMKKNENKKKQNKIIKMISILILITKITLITILVLAIKITLAIKTTPNIKNKILY